MNGVEKVDSEALCSYDLLYSNEIARKKSQGKNFSSLCSQNVDLPAAGSGGGQN